MFVLVNGLSFCELWLCGHPSLFNVVTVLSLDWGQVGRQWREQVMSREIERFGGASLDPSPATPS